MCVSGHISSRSVKPFQRYGHFSFLNGSRPPYWIGFTRFWTTHEEHSVVFAIVPNLVEMF